MPDINELLLELWIRWFIFYSVLLIYSVILVRLVNGIINFLFWSAHYQANPSRADGVIWFFVVALVSAIVLSILHMQGFMELPF